MPGGVLSYYKTGLTSGKMEGINRKIRGLLASAFGFRDQDFLKLRLYALHEAKFKFGRLRQNFRDEAKILPFSWNLPVLRASCDLLPRRPFFSASHSRVWRN